MSVESGFSAKIIKENSHTEGSEFDVLCADFENQLQDARDLLGANNSVNYLSLDVSKEPDDTVFSPVLSERVTIEDLEKVADFTLLCHKKILKQRPSWPSIRSVLEPRGDGFRVYRIVEFAVLINGEELLSIKQSVFDTTKNLVRQRLLAVSYSLAVLENTANVLQN